MAKTKFIWLLLTFIAVTATADTNTQPPKASLPASTKAPKTEVTKDLVAAKMAVIRWYDSYDTAVNMARFENKPMLVDFTAKWCGWCEKMDRDVFANEEVIAKLQKFICVRIDVDKQRDIAYAYAINSLPRVVVINTHSEMVGDWIGYRGWEDFSKLLDDVMDYTNKKIGAIEAPKITMTGTKSAPDIKAVSVTVDLSNAEIVLEQLANKDPAFRQAVITQLSATPVEAQAIATAGLESKYLGIRIASWELIKKINRTLIDYDPWASIKQRNVLLKPLKKVPEK